MRNRAEFKRAAKKRIGLKEAGQFSKPDGPGSRVAILMPFVARLVREKRDDLTSFEQDADALVAHLIANDREPVLRMRATIAEFESVITDPTITSVILRGFGSLSAVAVPEERGDDARFTHLDWMELSEMSRHLKLGYFQMRTCGGTPRLFNAPLPYGVMSSHRNISAAIGKVISVVGMEDPANALIKPVTPSEELTYEEIRERFPLQRMRRVPGFVPDAVYCGARALHNSTVLDAHMGSLSARSTGAT